jgi:hypothetical protein
MASHIEDRMVTNPQFLVVELDMAVKKNIPVQEEV